MITGIEIDYPRVLTVLWSNNWFPIKQGLAVLVIWLFPQSDASRAIVASGRSGR